MRFQVLLTEDAVQDLDEIHDHIGRHDDADRAERVLARLEAAIEGLAANPERGSHPKELLALGIRECRQAFFKPNRMIYRVVERRVYIYLVADGRRDMQTLLARRLLGA
jgi:toxin ParE1/3/4